MRAWVGSGCGCACVGSGCGCACVCARVCVRVRACVRACLVFVKLVSSKKAFRKVAASVPISSMPGMSSILLSSVAKCCASEVTNVSWSLVRCSIFPGKLPDQRVNCREWTKPAAQKVGDLYAGGSRGSWDRSIYLQQKQHLLNGGMSQVAEATSTTKPAHTKMSDIKEGAKGELQIAE